MSFYGWNAIDPRFVENIALTRAVEQGRLRLGSTLPEYAALNGLLAELGASAAVSFVPPGKTVSAFGAVGSGATDDTAAIQAALNAAVAYDTIYFPAGTYLISATLTVPTDHVKLLGPAKLLAKAATNFEYMLTATSRTGVVLEELEFDANKANRTSGQNIRLMGAGLLTCTDSAFIRCTARNVRGYASVSAVGLVSSAGTRNAVIGCRVFDCGDAGFDGDGIFTSGDQTLIALCQAKTGTDTAFVIESSNLSGIVGCTSDGFASGGAITNATVDHKRGNFIRGLTVQNWSATTGGIQLGMPGATAGHLYDTEVDAILYADTAGGKGIGPAIKVRVNGTGNVLGMSIKARIRGATTQGVLVQDGDDVTVEADIVGTGDACVQFQAGSNHKVQDSTLTGGTFGVITQGTAQATVRNTTCRGQSDHGLFAFDTSTLTDVATTVTTSGVAPRGKDAGATLTIQSIPATINVKDYGATGDGTTDDTAAIQAAITTGRSVSFPAGNYRCANLTQSTAFQRFVGLGDVLLTKNANGPILTSSGNNVQLENIKARGESATPAFTGHNLVFSGNGVLLLNCSSRWAYARAVKATGGRFTIIGTNDIYQTTDATGSGYDIELGVSGSATLYHHLTDIYSSQSTGGILLTDVGGASIIGGQFGKLTVAKGTGPAGTNGGMVSGCRILGAVTVGLDSALFTGCQVGAVVVTFQTGTPGCSFGISNTIESGGSIVNTGGASIQQPGVAAGSMDYSGAVNVPNNQAIGTKAAAGTVGGQLLQTAADNLQLNSLVSGKGLQLQQTGAAGVIQLVVDGVIVTQVDKSATATHTRILLYDVDKAVLSRVTVGINDSGGAGFKLLRVPN